jgi:hypothetical protein
MSQMLTGTAEREDSTRSSEFTELIPTPGMEIRTSRTSTISALFVAECKVSTAGRRLEARITIDGEVAHPGVAVLTTQSSYETRCHFAVKGQVPRGVHMVTVEWRVSRGTGYVRNRSLTVWGD